MEKLLADMAALAADLNASKSNDDEEQEPHRSWPPIFMSTKVIYTLMVCVVRVNRFNSK